MNKHPELQHDPGGKVCLPVDGEWLSEAEFSDCGCYRYKLSRRWASGPTVFFLMLNPSVATIKINDPTVAKCCRFARAWGYGGMYVGNVCAYRATDKLRLLQVPDPVGPRNHAALLEMAAVSPLIVAAHGKLPGQLRRHSHATVQLLRGAGHTLHILKLSIDLEPCHPLYLPGTLKPVVWK